MKKDILGIKIDDVNIDQAAETVVSWLKRGEQYYIVTPNPEIIVMAQKDEDLKRILNQASLAVPDGIGLKLTTDIKSYTPGIDLMEELIKRSLDYGFTIGLLGGEEGVADQAAKCLRKKYPNVKIVYADSGGRVDNEGKSLTLLKSLKLLRCDLLFVGFGPPKQEKWIAKNLAKSEVKVAMAVGGSLDYLSGRVPRAPQLFRKLGLEWLFRLITQPWRIKRQLALFKYLHLMLR